MAQVVENAAEQHTAAVLLTLAGSQTESVNVRTEDKEMKTYPRLDKMASGNLAIVLQGDVDYDNFEGIAKSWVKRLKLRVLQKADGVSERVWDCRLGDAKVWLAYDDWFPEISLEPQDDQAGVLVSGVFEKLKKESQSEPAGGTLRR